MRDNRIIAILTGWLYAGGFLDWYSTYLALSVGATEYNFFYNYFGMNIWVFWLWKLLLTFLYLELFKWFLSDIKLKKYKYFLYILITLLILSMGYLFINNILVYLIMR